MTTLYTILQDIRTALAESEDGELSSEAEANLTSLQLDLETKCDHIARYMQEVQADATAFEAESRRLNDLAKAAWSKADRLKQILKNNLEAAGIGRLDTTLFRFTICKNSQPSVRLVDGAEVPTEYQRIKVELDARKVVEAFRAGWPLPEGVVCEVGNHLRVR